ncbi:hypothetical protein SAMD00019534_034160, partial [Acytostelium subglobosum LB1]|uniref:hypothetical protein n=1 Tax=Acytostelium subglobosum LB1 TaxID=1410327 RepID=UPI000644F68A
MEYLSRVLLPKKRKSVEDDGSTSITSTSSTTSTSTSINDNNDNNNNNNTKTKFKNKFAIKYNNEKYDNDKTYYKSDVDQEKLSPNKQATLCDFLINHKEPEFELEHPLPIPEVINLRDNSGVLHWCPGFLTSRMAGVLQRHLTQVLKLEQREMKMYDRVVPLPRLMAWMSHEDAVSMYSEEKSQTVWTPPMLILKNALETMLNVEFEYVLINYYRDGKDHISFHSDKEARHEMTRVIASLSLGATRRFILKHIESKETMEYSLHAGDLIVMAGETQNHWMHMVPKEPRVITPRINLTFRCKMPDAAKELQITPATQTPSSTPLSLENFTGPTPPTQPPMSPERQLSPYLTPESLPPPVSKPSPPAPPIKPNNEPPLLQLAPRSPPPKLRPTLSLPTIKFGNKLTLPVSIAPSLSASKLAKGSTSALSPPNKLSALQHPPLPLSPPRSVTTPTNKRLSLPTLKPSHPLTILSLGTKKPLLQPQPPTNQVPVRPLSNSNQVKDDLDGLDFDFD